MREIITCGPRVLRRTSTRYTFTICPSCSSSPGTCSFMVSTASVASLPLPIRRITLPFRGSMRLTVPVRISCCLLPHSS